MWFCAPQGATGVTVERQEFACGFFDKNGRGYFEAPDHFAAKLLEIPGFEVSDKPEEAPEGSTLRMASSSVDPDVLLDLQRQLGELRTDNSALVAQLNHTTGLLEAVTRERDELKAKVEEMSTPSALPASGKK